MNLEQVVDAMAVAGWMPDLGVSLREGGQHSTNPEAKRAAIAFFDTALAVCKAESGFNPKADNPSSSAIGLWQIMQSVHKDMIAHEIDRWSSEFGKPVDITNPVVNTACAQRLFAERSWQPWEVYNNGTYRRHLGMGAKGYARAVQYATDPARLNALKDEFATGRALGAAIGGALMPVSGVVNDPDGWIGQALSGIASFAAPVGVFILGALLLLVGLWIAAGNPTPAKTIAKVVS